MKKVIYQFKYEGIFAMANLLAEKLITVLNREGVEFNMITFVPATRSRQVWRGYNQSEELAKAIGKITSVTTKNILIKKGDTKPQVGLTQKERRQNLTNKLVVKNNISIKNKKILIVDDVITTGSTLSECAKILKKSGAKQVWAVTLAKE